MTPAGDLGIQEGCSIPTKYSPGSPAVRPPSNPLGPSYLYSGRLVARGSCLLDEAQSPRATGWIDRLLREQGSRMQARDWLLGALWWRRSSERILQVKRERGWRTRRGEDQGPGAPGRDPAPDDRRPQPLGDWREGPSLAPRAKHPAAPTCYSQPLCPPLSVSAAQRRAGGDFKCSHPSRGTSPAHVTAAWRRPCPPHPDPAPLPEGAPWPLRPDGADTAILHLTGRPGRNSLYRRPGRGPHPTRTCSLFCSAPSDRGCPPLHPILPSVYPLPRLWAPSMIPTRECQCPSRYL